MDEDAFTFFVYGMGFEPPNVVDAHHNGKHGVSIKVDRLP